jgi:hypothetical protein
MAPRRTPSKRAWAPRDSLRWFRERCAQERVMTTAREQTAIAATVGAHLAELPNDASEMLPSELVPLLP